MPTGKKHKTKKYIKQHKREAANRKARQQKIHPASEQAADSPARRAFRELNKEEQHG